MRSAPPRLAESSCACVEARARPRSAPVRLAPSRLARLRFAPSSFARSRFAPSSSALSRLTSRRSAPARNASRRLAFFRLARASSRPFEVRALEVAAAEARPLEHRVGQVEPAEVGAIDLLAALDLLQDDFRGEIGHRLFVCLLCRDFERRRLGSTSVTASKMRARKMQTFTSERTCRAPFRGRPRARRFSARTAAGRWRAACRPPRAARGSP